MGIKFTCPACGRPLNVKSELGGKRGRCPKCQAKIDIPAESGVPPDAAGSSAVSEPGSTPAAATVAAVGTGLISVEEQTTILPASEGAAAMAAVDPIGEAPNLQWYAMPPGSANQYGPAAGEEFRLWMQEGRIPADALVWRQDWPEWKRAGSVFPQLATASATPVSVAAPQATAAQATAPQATVAAAPAVTAAAKAVMPGLPPLASAMSAPRSTPAAPFPAAPVATPVNDAFAFKTAEPATSRATSRGRTYRQRSNTGPVVAIVILLLAMIPLSFFVWKLVSEQLLSPPPATSPAGSNQPEE